MSPAARGLGRTFLRRGWIGFGLAAAISVGLAALTGRSVAAQTVVVLVAVATFLVLAMATKILLDREALIYYHHEIAVLTVTAGVAAVLGQPVAAHLDVTAAGLGAFLCLGRTGCLVVGCCHGRPAARGVRYGREHVEAGFPSYLEGVTLMPVQAIESLIVGLLVVATSALALVGEPGAAFGAYVTGYALARFALERWRGDAGRPTWHGVSAAQWTSIVVVAAVCALSLAGWLPHPALHAAALAILAAAAAHSLLSHRPAGRHPLDPEHVRSVSRTLEAITAQGRPQVRETSLGIQVSAGRVDGRALYALSRPSGVLGAPEAEAMARLLLGLRHPEGEVDLVPGVAGVWHVVVGEGKGPRP